MSIVTLKKKTANTVNASLANGQKSFSLNGTHRSQGYVGQTSLSRSLPKTIMRGNAIQGYGGCCGTYHITPIVQSAVTSTEDAGVVKHSVLNTDGMLTSKYECCHNYVKPDTTQNRNTQQQYIDNLHRCTVANTIHVNVSGGSMTTKDVVTLHNWERVLASAGVWNYCAMTPDGKYQFATSVQGGVYFSNNNPASWKQISNTLLPTNKYWTSIAISSNAQYQLLTVGNTPTQDTGGLYLSNDSGQSYTFITKTSLGLTNYTPLTSCAMSQSGQYMLACGVFGSNSGVILRSTDYGSTWSILFTYKSISCAMSFTGQYQIIGLQSTLTIGGVTSALLLSTDYGVNWIVSSLTGSVAPIDRCAVSQDGKYMIVSSRDSSLVYVSSDYGLSWTKKFGFSATEDYLSCGMSSNGKYQFVGSTKILHISSDYGTTWTQSSAPNANWTSVAISSDGAYQLATASSPGVNTGLYEYYTTTTKQTVSTSGKPSCSELRLNNKNRFDCLLGLTKNISGRGGIVATTQGEYLSLLAGKCNKNKTAMNGTASCPLPGPPSSH
jgi:photosystem II stability/assembly factor-like uncharacterized protein